MGEVLCTRISSFKSTFSIFLTKPIVPTKIVNVPTDYSGLKSGGQLPTLPTTGYVTELFEVKCSFLDKLS